MPRRDSSRLKALSKRIGQADVAFTMKQYQAGLDADRQVAATPAELSIGLTTHVRDSTHCPVTGADAMMADD